MRKLKLGNVDRETARLLVDFHLAAGTIKVTKCPEFARRNLDPKRGGGMMPGHLNPLTMGDHAHG